MDKLESEFQARLIKQLEELIPGCMILVKPGYYIQGFPDLFVLYKNMWVALECKRAADAPYEVNQKWYLAELDTMGYAATIYPENSKEIIDEVLRSFKLKR